MTKNSYLKQEIRTRMARTGESYSVAAQAIGRGEPLPELSSKQGDSFIHPGAGHPVANEDLLLFARHTSMLMGMGFELTEALEFTAEKVPNGELAGALRGIGRELDAGKDLFEAASAYPAIFSKIPLSRIKKFVDSCDLSHPGRRAQGKIMIDDLSKYYAAEVESGPLAQGESSTASYGDRVPLRDLIRFAEDLGHMLSTDVSLREAFEAMESVVENDQLRSAIREVLADTKRGKPFKVALARHPLAFPGIFVPMLRAHGDSANFARAFEKIAKSYRTELELQAAGSDSGIELSGEELAEDLARIFPKADRPRAALIGPPSVADYMGKMIPEWEFRNFSSIEDFQDALRSGAEGNDLVAIFIVDRLYEEDQGAFSKLASSMAPYCFFAVLSYDRFAQPSIRESVAATSYDLGVETPTIYFVDHLSPSRSFNSALDSFAKSGTRENQWALDRIFKLK